MSEDNKLELVNILVTFRTPITGLIVGLRPANERRRYFVTTSFIGWAQTYSRPCDYIHYISKSSTST